MSLFSPLTNIVKYVIDKVKGSGGSVLQFALNITAELPRLINSITEIFSMAKSDGTLDDEEKKKLIDEALDEFDGVTGVEGMSFFGSSDPTERLAEEQALDHFKEFLRFVAYKTQGVPVVSLVNNEE